MKKIFIYILSIFSIVAFHSCSDREDIRNDINDLIARLDKLQPEIDKLNVYIANYQDLLNGKIFVLGYTVNEETGDYVLDLSNGQRMSVYSGKPSEPLPVMSIGEDGYWYYTMYGEETKPLLDNNNNPVYAGPENGKTPEFRINSEGMWEYSFGDGNWIGGIGYADPSVATFSYSLFDEVIPDESAGTITFKWTVEGVQQQFTAPLYGGLSLTIGYETSPVVFSLNEEKIFTVKQEGIEKIVIETVGWGIKIDEEQMTVTAPSTNKNGAPYEEDLIIKIFSKEGYCRLVTMKVKLLTTELYAGAATAWTNFVSNTDNKLQDYSYAGYNYGESAPVDGFAWGYKVINVYDVMTENKLTAREALEKILDDNSLIRKANTNATNSNARIVIYFPKGDYVLQEEGNTTKPLPIYGGNFIIKGDGPENTKLIMKNEIGTDESSAGALITIQHSNSPRNIKNSKSLGNITANASKGDRTVTGNFHDVKSGDWVQLRLRSNSDDLLKEELGVLYDQKKDTWSITKAPGLAANNETEDGNGIRIMEFHKVESATSTSVTFYDPIMSDIDVSIAGDYNGGWELREYKCYENVGIEDLSFVGNAPTPYYHHGQATSGSPTIDNPAWMYDASYKPVIFIRVVNSWIRNVNFTSVSEAVSFDQSALCSAYNIKINGVRGHSAVRAQESTRVFIGNVTDESSETGGYNGIGQWHGCGVSKPSIGTVVWNTSWGSNACFESHATQPRATLFDNCRGGLIRYHAGGADTENPNHLRDLTIWNLQVTGTTSEQGSWSTDFKWWDSGSDYWKIYPPIVVGVNGVDANFFTDDANQLTYEESTGTKVTPESLYEAQLRQRLGYVPAWLNALK